jgi:hypothetical protein
LLIDLPRAPHHPRRKVYFGAIHAVLSLQKKYGYAGWFRIKGYLEQDYGIYLSPTTIKKIMALNSLTRYGCVSRSNRAARIFNDPQRRSVGLSNYGFISGRNWSNPHRVSVSARAPQC